MCTMYMCDGVGTVTVLGLDSCVVMYFFASRGCGWRFSELCQRHYS